ncbi:AraC family transcriptional regulator [Aureivirga sp. CE67]|uniref:AraC family transcriptional regulator n=1 Tax=Aureivirga sp. CE67 TaxID=1788983 RepID=UPI0018C8FEE1|nr:AraC family transcriptional regulator [Aureivirga sp. CE67]
MDKLPIFSIQQFNCRKFNSDFYINDLNSHLSGHDFISKPHKHNFYLTVIFTNGTGVHEIDFKKYDVKKGSIFFLSPGQIHHWNLSQDIDGYIFFHTKDFYNLYFNTKRIEDYPFYNSFLNTPSYSIKEEDLDLFLNYINEIKEEYLNNYSEDNLILNLLDVFYVKLNRLLITEIENNFQNNSYVHQIQKLEKIIDENYVHSKNPSFYADKMHTSLKHLNRICKETIGITLTNFIMDRVILEAKRLLIHTDIPISETALKLGYDDYSYFSRVFKKYENMTPKTFKNKYFET